MELGRTIDLMVDAHQIKSEHKCGKKVYKNFEGSLFYLVEIVKRKRKQKYKSLKAYPSKQSC